MQALIQWDCTELEESTPKCRSWWPQSFVSRMKRKSFIHIFVPFRLCLCTVYTAVYLTLTDLLYCNVPYLNMDTSFPNAWMSFFHIFWSCGVWTPLFWQLSQVEFRAVANLMWPCRVRKEVLLVVWQRNCHLPSYLCGSALLDVPR